MSAEIRKIDEGAATKIGAKEAKIRELANNLHKLNNSIIGAVEAGVTVELIRSSRHHCGAGNCGDLLVPVITQRGEN